MLGLWHHQNANYYNIASNKKTFLKWFTKET
jgi:hypothetical protein